jgi:hypothetical protein
MISNCFKNIKLQKAFQIFMMIDANSTLAKSKKLAKLLLKEFSNTYGPQLEKEATPH